MKNKMNFREHSHKPNTKKTRSSPFPSDDTDYSKDGEYINYKEIN